MCSFRASLSLSVKAVGAAERTRTVQAQERRGWERQTSVWQSAHHHGRLNVSLLHRAGGAAEQGLVMIAAVPETDTRKDG